MSDLVFQSLLDNINCKTVVVFEDDFGLELSKENISFNYLYNLTPNDKAILLDFLSKKNHEDVCKSLKKLEGDISFKYDDYFDFAQAVNNTPAIKQLIHELPLSKDIEDIFYIFGLLIPLDIPKDYGIIIGAVRAIDNTSIRLFRTYNEYENYQIIVEETIKKTGSEFVLFIIDHYLTNSTHKGQAIEHMLAKTFGPQHLSFIFSSQLTANEGMGVSDKRNFDMNELYNATVNSFYKSLFKRLQILNNQCVDEAYDIASKNYKNIKFIIKTALKEGTHPFEAINNWYCKAINFFFSDKRPKAIDRFAESVNKYKLTIIPPIDPEDLDIIERINCHEVFDYSINKLYEPPSLGDIFFSETDNKYYVLLGQSCDLTLREDNMRNAKIAELVEANILKNTPLTKKMRHNNNDGVITIEFRDFFDISSNPSVLQVNFSGKNIRHTSFDILDCIMFNSDGRSKINPSEDLQNSNCILHNRIEYYEKLKTKIDHLWDMKKNDITFDDYLDISPQNQLFYKNDIFDFKISRVARIQNVYALFLNKLYYDHKGRIGVNTVRNTEYHYREKLDVSLLGNKTSQNIENIYVYYDKAKKKKYILKSDLLNSLQGKIVTVIEMFKSDWIYIKNGQEYCLKENDDFLELVINIPVSFNENVKFIKRLTISSILGNSSPGGGEFNINGTEKQLKNNEQIDFLDLQKGINNSKYSIGIDGYAIKVVEQ